MKSSHPVDIKLGSNLEKIRTSQGMAADDLGLCLGQPVSYQQIRKYERGENRIATRTVLEFCVILNCSINDMFEGVFDLMKKNVALDPYAPPIIEPYILDEDNLSSQHKILLKNFIFHINNELSKFLVREKDINHG